MPFLGKALPDMHEWASWLVQFKKPVVWFDKYDEPDVAARMPRESPHYYRCHFDERTGVRAALEALAAFGHRRIGIPNPKGSYQSWVARRGEMFREEASRLDSPPTVHVQEKVVYPWKGDKDREKILRRWRRTGLLHVRRALADHDAGKQVGFFNSILYNTCILTPFIRDLQCTAIVAPNDYLAREYSAWCSAAGIRFPRDISLVSFDNAPSLHPFPIASVDFGFAGLGYTAFHIFLSDIGIKRPPKGDLPAQPRLVFRRTLGKARRGAMKVDLRGDCV
jgi:DNA-binding LacI/PurR family transcriptional regulator